MFSLIPWTRQRNRENALTIDRPQHPFDALRQSFDSIFDRALGDWASLFDGASRGSALHGLETCGMNLRETDREVHVSMDAPGFEAGDFDVQICGTTVKVSAARESNESGAVSRRLQRYVELPVEVEPDKVQAQYKNGVLELTFQKAEHAQWRKIDVNA